MTDHLFTEEGRTRLRNFVLRLRGYFTFCTVVALLMVGPVWWLLLRPLQADYLWQYVQVNVRMIMFPRSSSTYTMFGYDWEGKRAFVTNEDYAIRAGVAEWRQVGLWDAQAEQLMRDGIYGGHSLIWFVAGPLVIVLGLAIGGTVPLALFDQRINRKYAQGKRLRGSRLVKPQKFERDHSEADGLALNVKSMTGKGSAQLRMRKAEEAQGLLILGDIGSGKSQILHRYLGQLARREGEAAIIYDPAGEFSQAHYNADRGDLILNPLDARSPFWSPANEIKYTTDYLSVAECFFPCPHFARDSDKFFAEAGREIFARMLEDRPSLAELIKWCGDAKTIDTFCKDTELQHYVDKTAGDQRGGVLATIGRVVKTLRILPKVEECTRDFSLTEWAERRRGWLFLTVTREAEEQLRPLYTAYLDLLMRRLMSGQGNGRSVQLVIDELHTLEYLPTLYRAITEGRKYKISVWQGTQNKAQYDQRYRQDAPTMLSCARHKIVLRCSEPDSARWLSDLLGDEEREKPRPSVTASVADQGRDSMTYSSETRNRPVVSREEIASLPDLAGYWKYGDAVVPFKIDFVERPRVADGFIPRRILTPARPADHLADQFTSTSGETQAAD